jgi:hypothetical protein
MSESQYFKNISSSMHHILDFLASKYFFGLERNDLTHGVTQVK